MENLTQNEIDSLTLADFAHTLLKADGEVNTAILYKKITKLKKMSKTEYENTITDFFSILNLDRRFVLLDNGNWGLRENHAINNDFESLLNEEETDALIEEETEDDDEIIEIFINDDGDDVFDDSDPEMTNLVVVEEDLNEE